MTNWLKRCSGRTLVALLGIISLPYFASAQVPNYQDCLGAMPICLSSYANANLVTGTGNIPNEINPATSCLLTGERNDMWYIITTSTSGNLAFSIVPNVATHNYDWAVYNLTSAICSEIFTNPALEVACNYSNTPGTTGPNGLPGAQNGAVIPASAGQTYLINVSGFSSINQGGYTIDLSGSTAIVTDNTTPTMSSITAMNCGATTMNLSFSERVKCNSVSTSDFTLTGPGGPYTITSITGTSCSLNATYSRDFIVNFSPAIQTAGTYTLTMVSAVTDLCNNNASVPQAFPIPISGVNISFTKNDVTCFGGNNGSATANVSGTAGPFLYQWAPSGGSGPTAQFLTAGNYTVTVSSPLGCSAQSTVAINQPLTGLSASVVTTPANGCASNGSATVTPSNGQAPYTYSWWPSGGSAATANNLAAGGYMVTITDANQCVLNYFLNVPSAAGPSVAINTFSGVSCFGGNDGSATVSVTNATGPFSYLWSPSGGTGATANGLTAGSYSVAVTVSPGCTLTATVVITEPPTGLSVSKTIVPTSCGINNGSITINASGGVAPYSYSWNPPVATGSSATWLASGSYSVTITDANGCSNVQNATVAPSSPVTASLQNHSNVACYGQNSGSTGVSVSGGQTPYSILWSSGQTTANISNIGAGIYTVTVTDAAGCSKVLTDTITEPSAFTATLVNSTNIQCFGLSTGAATVSTLGGAGGNVWSWTNSSSTLPSINNVAAGNYTATVTDQNGCSASVSVTITQPATAVNIQGTVTATTCGNSDGAVTTNVSGGTTPYTYNWNTGAVSASLTGLIPGIYALTVTDANGCIDSATYNVQASNAPVISLINSTDVTCFGGSNGAASFGAVGGVTPYTWVWQNGISTGTSANNLPAGTYNVTITDASGCQAFDQVTINQPTAIAVQLSAPVTICYGGNTVVTSAVTGGTQPYSYNWSNGAAVAQIMVSPSANASYQVTVSDANGCSVASNPVIVTVRSPLALSAVYPDSVCKNSNATVQLLASGGDGNYTYTWSNGSTGSQNQILISGNTSLTIQLADGCNTPPVSAAVSITAVEAPTLSFNIPQQTGCEPLVTNFAIPSGTPSGFVYTWEFGDGYVSQLPAVSHTYLQSGTYNVSLTVAYAGAGGCSSELNFPALVKVFQKPVARFISDPPAPTLNHPEVFFTDRSTAADLWYWTFGDNIGESREQNTSYIYSDTGQYVVHLRVSTSEGCRDSVAEVIHVGEEMQIFIPNAFTPDASGVNDVFQIYGVGFSSYEISIYDRWGKLVHRAKNQDVAWDGNDIATGDPVPQGVYVYKVTIIDNSGNVINKFDRITLLR
ncbi:MAG: gliding motility-associated C-terminal domain-containing protein [Bacteroidetes bacterium]|nr:gliding motility-associated C-terminal domain-containing protein [Bacteroidota bacterium]